LDEKEWNPDSILEHNRNSETPDLMSRLMKNGVKSKFKAIVGNKQTSKDNQNE